MCQYANKTMKKTFFVKIGLASIIFLSLLTVAFGKGEPETTVYEDAEIYHKQMNELFNGKAKLLTSGDLPAESYEVPKEALQDCATDEECKKAVEKCREAANNVTTFCLAAEASDLYVEFRKNLISKWGKIENPEGSETLTGLFDEMSAKQGFIEEQIMRSKAALDMALNAYNELRWAYALHKEYKQVIKDLLKYRDGIADVRKYVEQYPDRFIDASTPYCK